MLVRALQSAVGHNFVFDEDQIYDLSDFWAERYSAEGLVEKLAPEAAAIVGGAERATQNPPLRIRTPRTRKGK